MPTDKFLISSLQTGLQRDAQAWQLMDDAFFNLRNVYVFRGTARKRPGSVWTGTNQLDSRLAINLGNTTGAGNIGPVIVPNNGLASAFAVGQMFSIGTEIFTVQAAGTPVIMLTTGASTVHTYNTTNGTLEINGAAATTPVYFYPAKPVMGITIYDKAGSTINNQPTYAFDTEFVYVFNGANWLRSGTAVWHGTDLNFFWTCNWTGITDDIKVLFVTNFNATIGVPGANDDPIWWTLDGTNWTAGTGANAFYFLPNGGLVQTGPYVKTCRLIVNFKNRLLLLNTVENNNAGGAGTNIAYTNRCRYSHNGSPFARNAWYEPNQADSSGGVVNNNNIADGAGFIDATTDEQIISCEFIKDRLIVFFERSTWELAYTGNEVLPFIWQKINTELGAESQFSAVPFDKMILAIGNTGVQSCNGANVERIDNKIPDLIYNLKLANVSIQRVCGIRDYFSELVYWAYPSDFENPLNVYPNKILTYNYRNDSWAIFDDSVTAFGYFEQSLAPTWLATVPITWEEANGEWGDILEQGNSRQVIAGNQEGYLFKFQRDLSFNASVLQITNMANLGINVVLTIINHNLNDESDFGDYIYIINAQGINAGFNGKVYQVISVISANQILIDADNFTGVYTGGGTATRVNNLQLQSKQWNPYLKDGANVYVSKIEFAVQRTATGAITVDYSASSSDLSILEDGIATGTILGTSVLDTFPYTTIYPLEASQATLWHPVYFQSVGEFIQIDMFMTKQQMETFNIAFSDFEMQGLMLYTSRVTRLQ